MKTHTTPTRNLSHAEQSRARLHLLLVAIAFLAVGFAAGYFSDWSREVDYPTAASIAFAPAQQAAGDAGVKAAPPPHEAIYVSNADSDAVTVYPLGAGGNLAPAAVIAGPLTGLKSPRAIAIGPGGDLYVANSRSLMIFSASSTGNAVPGAIIAGPATRLAQCGGIALGAHGEIYALNNFADPVTVYPADSNGNIEPAAFVSIETTGKRLPQGFWHVPAAIAVDAGGSIYVALESPESIAIYRAGASGSMSRTAVIAGALTGLSRPRAIAVGPRGNIYVSNSGGPSITVYPPGSTGEVRPIATIFGPSTRMVAPTAIALDRNANILVGDRSANAVLEYSAGAGGDAAPIRVISGAATRLAGVTGIAIRQ